MEPSPSRSAYPCSSRQIKNNNNFPEMPRDDLTSPGTSALFDLALERAPIG